MYNGQFRAFKEDFSAGFHQSEPLGTLRKLFLPLVEPYSVRSDDPPEAPQQLNGKEIPTLLLAALKAPGAAENH